MIKDSFEAFSKGYILAAEAGTGLGKSLAYLSSGFLTAKQKETALVVSTYTKNLQSKLFTEYIRKLSTAIDKNLNGVIYKGRYYYFCRTPKCSMLFLGSAGATTWKCSPTPQFAATCVALGTNHCIFAAGIFRQSFLLLFFD